MKKILGVFLSFVFAASLAAVPACAEPEVGQPAPDFTLTGVDGQTHSLAQHKGKFVVLEWVNHGCPFVVKHYDSGNMPNLQKNYVDKGVVWLSICSSAPGKQGHHSAQEWEKLLAEKNSSAIATLLDEDGKVGKAYGAKTTPHMFVVNPEGTLVYKGAIDSIPSAEQADVQKAKNHVAAALDEAMAGQPVTESSTKPYGCSVKYA